MTLQAQVEGHNFPDLFMGFKLLHVVAAALSSIAGVDKLSHLLEHLVGSEVTHKILTVVSGIERLFETR
jgi:hypothetical protein